MCRGLVHIGLDRSRPQMRLTVLPRCQRLHVVVAAETVFGGAVQLPIRPNRTLQLSTSRAPLAESAVASADSMRRPISRPSSRARRFPRRQGYCGAPRTTTSISEPEEPRGERGRAPSLKSSTAGHRTQLSGANCVYAQASLMPKSLLAMSSLVQSASRADRDLPDAFFLQSSKWSWKYRPPAVIVTVALSSIGSGNHHGKLRHDFRARYQRVN